MSFTFDTTIPNAPNNPSVDQPGMLQNNVSTNGILGVDHITFNALGGGQHKQITFNGKNVPGVQTDPQSVLYTNNITVATGDNTTSASTVAEMFYRNQNAIFPVSMIKAFGCFDAAATSLNTWNISASGPVTRTFTLTMPANVVTGTNYAVFCLSTFTANSISYNILSATQFTVTFSNVAVGFSVLVMQL